MQSEVIFFHSVRLVGKLLKHREKSSTVSPALSDFQLHLSRSVIEALTTTEGGDDTKVREPGLNITVHL